MMDNSLIIIKVITNIIKKKNTKIIRMQIKHCFNSTSSSMNSLMYL